MPLSSSAAAPGSGAARTCPLSGIKWRCGFAVKVFGGGTGARGPEESGLQAAMIHAAAAVPSTVDRRERFTGVLRLHGALERRNSDATEARGGVCGGRDALVWPGRCGWGA